MFKSLLFVCVYVENLKEAFDFYVNKLGFVEIGKSNDSVTVAPSRNSETLIVLEPEDLKDWVNRSSGNSPLMALETKDCYEAVEELRARGVPIVTEPRETNDGIQAVIGDLYANHYLLIESRKSGSGEVLLSPRTFLQDVSRY